MRRPPRRAPLERVALRRERPAAQVVERRLVRVHVADARAAFDRHVADRHPLVHRHALDGVAGVLVGVADAAVHAEAADDLEDHVLRVDARREPAVDLDPPDLQRLHRQALRREDVAHLRRADAEGDGAERAVRRGVAVAAGDRHARLRQPQLRPDHMHDALRARCRGRAAGCRARGSSARAPPACPRPSRRGTAAAGRASGRCDRRCAKVRSGIRTRHPRARNMSKACGVVTSWIRCRPMNSCVCPFGRRRTVCASQTFSSRVEGIAEVDRVRVAVGGSGFGVRGSGFGSDSLPKATGGM